MQLSDLVDRRDFKVDISSLKKYDLIYVGTPYTKYPAGIEAAFIDACKFTAKLMKAGLRVYSPIAHTHPIAIHGGIDPLAVNDIWIPFDKAMMAKSDAMIVAEMETWEQSGGIQHELDTFAEAVKPIYYIDPVTMEVREDLRNIFVGLQWGVV